MPPKRGVAKQEEEEQHRAEEEAAAIQANKELRQMMAGEAVGGKVDPTMAMFAMMQQQMQRQEERMQRHMQQQMDMLADRLAAGDAPAGGGGHGGAGAGGHGGGGAAAATRSRKMEAPHLKSPKDTTLAVFRDWRERFTEYQQSPSLTQSVNGGPDAECYARPSTRTGAGCGLRVCWRLTTPTTGETSWI